MRMRVGGGSTLTATTLALSGNPIHQVVWSGGGLQCDGHGAPRAQPRGPLQLLLPQVQPQDGAAPGGPDGESPSSVLPSLVLWALLGLWLPFQPLFPHRAQGTSPAFCL